MHHSTVAHGCTHGGGIAWRVHRVAQEQCLASKSMAARTAAASRGTSMDDSSMRSTPAESGRPRGPVEKGQNWLMDAAIQHGVCCHASMSCCTGDSTRSAHSVALSLTAALLNATAAWHVMPCIDWLPPTRWQHTLGKRCRASLNYSRILACSCSMARDAMHRLATAHKVTAYARRVIPHLARQLHSWMQLQHGT